jgi:hypothetical protein
MVWYGMLWCGVVGCSMVFVVWYDMVKYGKIW